MIITHIISGSLDWKQISNGLPACKIKLNYNISSEVFIDGFYLIKHKSDVSFSSIRTWKINGTISTDSKL